MNASLSSSWAGPLAASSVWDENRCGMSVVENPQQCQVTRPHRRRYGRPCDQRQA